MALLEATLTVALVLLVVQAAVFLFYVPSTTMLPSDSFLLIEPRRSPIAAAAAAARPAAAFRARHYDDESLGKLDIACGANLTRLGSKIGKGNSKKAYDARCGELVGVLKVPNDEANVYNLSTREFARVFHDEAVLLRRLAHRNVVRLLGACGDGNESSVFTFVERLRPWASVLRDVPLSAAERWRMARGVAELVRLWNHGATPLGVLVHCDFLPQQWGVAALELDVKLLDIEGLRALPDNRTAFFADVRCESDAVCRRPGCYKSAAEALRFRDSFDGFEPAAAIDETRCNEQTGLCNGMGVEWNVFAMCRFLFQDLLGPLGAAARPLLSRCLDSRLETRATIDQVLDEIVNKQKQ